MANDVYNYSVMTNTGKGFITHTDHRKFDISGYPGNVWVCDDIPESRDWVARNSGAVKTKSQAQTIVTDIVEAEQATWDDLSDDAKALTSGRPATITLP